MRQGDDGLIQRAALPALHHRTQERCTAPLRHRPDEARARKEEVRMKKRARHRVRRERQGHSVRKAQRAVRVNALRRNRTDRANRVILRRQIARQHRLSVFHRAVVQRAQELLLPVALKAHRRMRQQRIAFAVPERFHRSKSHFRADKVSQRPERRHIAFFGGCRGFRQHQRVRQRIAVQGVLPRGGQRLGRFRPVRRLHQYQDSLHVVPPLYYF